LFGLVRTLRKAIRKYLMKILGIILIVIIVVPTLLYFLQRRMIYFPGKYEPGYRDWLPPGAVEIEYETSSGKQVCFYIPQAGGEGKPPARLWMLFGGNASLALHWLDFIGEFPGEAPAFLLIDYPGYGFCEGRPGFHSIGENSRAAFSALARNLETTEAVLGKELGVMGHSLGCAAALQFAAGHPVKRAILIAPFTSLLEMARRSVGWPLCHILRDRFDNRSVLQQILSRPSPPEIHVLHGTGDEIVPFNMGKSLSDSFPGKIGFHPLEGSDHNSILFDAREEMYRLMTR